MTKRTYILIGLIIFIILLALYFVVLKPEGNTSGLPDRQVPAGTQSGLPNANQGGYANPIPTQVPAAKSAEETIFADIQTSLSNWNPANETDSMKNALLRTNEPDNETVLEAWIPFLKERSSDLIRYIGTIESESEKKEMALIAANLYEWMIQGNGGYNDLPAIKKQQLLMEYEQLKLFSR